MDFGKHVKGNALSLPLHSTINISKLVSFLQDHTSITELDLQCQNIGGEDAKALAKLTTLKSLNLWQNKISDEGAEALAKSKNLFIIFSVVKQQRQEQPFVSWC